MDIRTWRVEINQDQIDLKDIKIHPDAHSVNDITRSLPSGAYTTFRTYHGRKVLRISDHVERLENTGRLIGRTICIDESHFRASLREAMRRYPHNGEIRFRISVDLSERIGDMYVTIEKLQTPPIQAYQQGVDVLTCELEREVPKAKLTDFISKADNIRGKLPPGVHEVLIVNTQGQILEGLSSNFFAVLQGEIWTEEETVLSGITRTLVLECLQVMGHSVKFCAIGIDQVSDLDESFITSASRGVLPVRRIDQQEIGRVCPGELTREISRVYEMQIQSEVESI